MPSNNHPQSLSGLYAITPQTSDDLSLFKNVEAALVGGVRVLQYREKQLTGVDKEQRARTLLVMCQRYQVPLIINDDVELALAIGADGVHLGRDDVSIEQARAQLPENRIIGVSCYNRLPLAVAAAEAGADYVAFGSFFPSSTKPEAVAASFDLIEKFKQQYSLPVVAIGGITPSGAETLFEAGADMVAVISYLFDAPCPKVAAQQFPTR